MNETRDSSDLGVKRLVSVSVRELVEFVLRSGDLGGGEGFSGANRALEGTRGHQRVQRTRPPGYLAEVPVCWRREGGEFTFELKGRMDGVLEEGGRVCIEEIKTVRRAWTGPADPLHLAQGKVYAWVYATQNNLAAIDIRITYLDLSTDHCFEIAHSFSTGELTAFFEPLIDEYLSWVRDHHAWCDLRDRSIRALSFPFSSYRPGQRTLAVSVYRTVKGRSRLFAEAPTGIGKTVSTLFPALKALGEGGVERIFYLTAKTVGRAVAEKAVAELRAAGGRIRSVTLTARDKICFNDGQRCDVAKCPFAVGYYDRIKVAMRDALAGDSFTRSELEAVARKHVVCPFELSLDLSRWVELVICDYNYAFDPSASLRRYFDNERNDYVLLVDEAHNLVDRAREMHSAELTRGALTEVRDVVKDELPNCARALGRASRWISALRKSEAWIERDGVLVSEEAPSKIKAALDKFLEEAEAWLVMNLAAAYRTALLDLYFQVLSFQRVLESFDGRYRTILNEERGSIRLFCVDPAESLSAVLNKVAATVFFSATLRPLDFHRLSLGGGTGDGQMQLDSPFPPEHLCVLVQDRIDTRWKAREGNHERVCAAIGAVVRARPGNYLVYFPSYAYLAAVRERFSAEFPEIDLEVQQSGMSEGARAEFLKRFEPRASGTLVAFAVLGGVFGEGIDLIGDRLIGVIVVGVGLPLVSVERELIREYWEGENRSGFDYAYTYPGINRVLQAAGRVIRSEADRGIVMLIDDRFGRRDYRALWPAHWRGQAARTVEAISQAARSFWDREKSLTGVAKH